ncbi:F-box domain-containing protein [Diplocarpon rosae]|nr:F-box domain-containing protein [Diplocarpon rosae]
MNANGILYTEEDLKRPLPRSAPGAISAFDRLPNEIIELILQLASPNSFASLIVLNRKWRTVSQQVHLYAHHLSRCPSYAAAHRGVPILEDEESLPHLRRLFARETKRNLFDAYLRPRETIINLVSTSISPTSAPGGEAFHFSLSPRGQYILAYNSSRIHVIDVTGPDILIKRELKILRRPVSTTITDDGLLLAVLSTDLQVDLYDLSGKCPEYTRAVALDHTPRTIALSPAGSVLAAAYDSGVEVWSLDPSFASTERRSVKCYAADSLSFSRDGTQLLGTTMQSRYPSTVVLTAPYYDPSGSLPDDSISSLWTTSILFPNGSRDCSHAVLLPNSSDEEVSWAFTYDRVFETFRTVRIDDLRNGTTYFTGPITDFSYASRLLPSTLPAASESGHLVASGFQGAIWLYGIPEDLAALPNVKDSPIGSPETGVSTPSTYLGRRNSAPSLRSINRHRDSLSRSPQWQLLGDKFRNTFVQGRKVGSLDRVSALAWVNRQSAKLFGERLVAVAPGVEARANIEDDGIDAVDGGRISLLDFNYNTSDGVKTYITIEVGMNEPQILEEEHRALDVEVAILRRRTVAQRQENRGFVSRAAAAPRSSRLELPKHTTRDTGNSSEPRSCNSLARNPSQQTALIEQSETASSLDDDQEAFDAPYSHTNPRSGTTLRRAATAAAVNRRFHPTPEEHFEYRRADGRDEHPHESDADNWVPPPPPYSRHSLPPLPEHIQRSLLAEAASATSERSGTHRAPSFGFSGLDSCSLHRSHTIATMASSSTLESRRDRTQLHMCPSDSANIMSDRPSLEEAPRLETSPASNDFDDLYDVSPQGSLPPSPRPRSIIIDHILGRPVGAPTYPHAAPTPSIPHPVMLATFPRPVSPIQQSAHPQDIVRQCEGPVNIKFEGDLGVTKENLSISGDAIAQSEAVLVSKPAPVAHAWADTQGESRYVNQRVPPLLETSYPLPEPSTSTPLSQAQQRNTASQKTPTRCSGVLPITKSPPQNTLGGLMPASERAETASVASSLPTPIPSADQLARLNSRQGRPAGLIDPCRPLSGSISGDRGAMQSNPSRLTPDEAFNRSQAPHDAVGVFGSSPNQYEQGDSLQGSTYSHSPQGGFYSSPSRRPSGGGHNRNTSTSLSNLRPPMSRLETIHSQSSTNGGETFHYFNRSSVMVSRPVSRAETGVAKNIQSAKKKGWRFMRKEKRKERPGDGTSSAEWTEASRNSVMLGGRVQGEKKDSKCTIM